MSTNKGESEPQPEEDIVLRIVGNSELAERVRLTATSSGSAPKDLMRYGLAFMLDFYEAKLLNPHVRLAFVQPHLDEAGVPSKNERTIYELDFNPDIVT